MVQSRMSGEGDLSKPERFTPSWPPRAEIKPLPNIFTRCSDKFKKVTWPPTEDEGPGAVEPPPSNVHLLDEIPLNDTAIRPVGTYKAAPTVYADDPEQLSEEVWPPPEPIDTSERVIHDPSRPKRAVRDYTVHFSKNAAPPTQPTYQVPPGTLHVISKRGVLSYDTPDLGGARMAKEEK